MKLPLIFIILLLTTLLPSFAQAQQLPVDGTGKLSQAVSPAPAPEQITAMLQGLDKITARVTRIAAPLGEVVRFGTLEIIVRRCHKRPPTETPETTVYLEIRERRRGETAVDLFAGWMFASSPAASSMEHPVYDVWVVDCTKLSSSD